MVDHSTADVADDNAMLIATDTTRDLLLVHDVLTNLRPVKDLAVKIRAFAEDSSEALAEIRMPLREDSATCIFDHTVG